MRWLLNRIALIVFTALCFGAVNTLCSIEITANNSYTEQQRKIQPYQSDLILNLIDRCNVKTNLSTRLHLTFHYSKKNRLFDSSGHRNSYLFIFANKLYVYIRTLNKTVVLFSRSDIIFPFHYYW